MAETERKRLHALIEGYVQGVGFRYFVQDKASELGLSGWVRNLYNGNVEVLVEGDQHSLGKLLTLLHLGPRGSHVTSVTPVWQEATGEFRGFQVRYTV